MDTFDVNWCCLHKLGFAFFLIFQCVMFHFLILLQEILATEHGRTCSSVLLILSTSNLSYY